MDTTDWKDLTGRAAAAEAQQPPTLLELRREAAGALMHYRRAKQYLQALDAGEPQPAPPWRARREDAAKARCTPEEEARLRGWVAAVDNARAMLRRAYPLKERFMARCFGLDVPIPRSHGVKARLLKLSLDMHVSQSTLYRWREDAIELTLYGAIEAGVLRPFGLSQPG